MSTLHTLIAELRQQAAQGAIVPVAAEDLNRLLDAADRAERFSQGPSLRSKLDPACSGEAHMAEQAGALGWLP